MADAGFAGMSMEQVAAKAGVPKPTVYRRWCSKADLATAALARLQASEPAPRAGSARAEIIAILASFRRNLLRPHGMAMLGALLVEEERHPDFIALFRSRIVEPRRRKLRAALQRGIARGEVRTGADLDVAGNFLVGSFYARYLTGSGIPPQWPRRIVAALWDGIAA